LLYDTDILYHTGVVYGAIRKEYTAKRDIVAYLFIALAVWHRHVGQRCV